MAYLDGELDAEQSRRIEERAAAEPDTRRMLEELDRTWHMLDELDAPPTSEDFTRTTLEMVALAAVEDVEKAKAQRPRRRLRAGLWAAAGLIAAAAAGFLHRHVPDPRPQRPTAAGPADPGEFRSVPRDRQHRFSAGLEQRKTVRGGQPMPAVGPGRRPGARGNALPAAPAGGANVRRTTRGPVPQRAAVSRLVAPGSAADPRPARSDRKRSRPGQTPDNHEPLLQVVRGAAAVPPRQADGQEEDAARPHCDGRRTRAQSKVRARISAWTTEIAEPWPPGWIITPRSTDLDSSRAWPRPTRTIAKLPPERQQAVLREIALAALADGRSGRTDADRGARVGSDSCAGLSPELRAKLEAKTPAEQNRIIAEWLRETASHELDEQLASFFESKWIDDEERDRLMSPSQRRDVQEPERPVQRPLKAIEAGRASSPAARPSPRHMASTREP